MGSRRIGPFVSFAAMFVASVVAQDAAKPTCRIRARIVDENGRPIAGAGAVFGERASITTDDALHRPGARSNADGVLELLAKVPESLMTPRMLLIAAPNRVAFRHPHPERTSRSRYAVLAAVDLGDVRLPAGHTMTGRVRDAAGKPIAGARVTAFDQIDEKSRFRPAFASCARSDAEGVFTLPCVFASATTIDIEADGFFTRTLPDVGPGTPLDVRLETSGFVEGAVLDAAGKPMRGELSCLWQLDERPTVITVGADGAFRLPVQHHGQLRLSLHGADTKVVAQSDVLDGLCSGVEVRAVADAQRFLIRAKVRDTGEPVRAIRAAVYWSKALPASPDPALETSLAPARSDGAVPVTRPSPEDGDRGAALVRADGFAPVRIPEITYRDGESYVAELVPESRIGGRVLDAKGEPIAGITVQCTRSALRDGRDRQKASIWAAPFDAAVTGADGAFEFCQLAAESHVVEVQWPGGTERAMRTCRPSSGETLSGCDLQLHPGVVVRVRASGAPDDTELWLALSADRPFTDGAEWSKGRLAAWNFENSQRAVNGELVFPHRAAGHETLWLLVPRPPRQGAAIVIPITEVDIGTADVALDVDLAAHRPGSIVSKVIFEGVQPPPGRLVVVATRQNDLPPLAVPRPPFVERRWAMVEPDGSFALVLGPGDHDLSIVDTSTGLAVHDAKKLHVTAGCMLHDEIRCQLAEVRVSFDGAAGGRPTARFLRLGAAAERGWPSRAVFGFSLYGSAGCEIDSLDTRSFFAAPGTLRLWLTGAASAIDMGWKMHPAFDSGDATEIDVEAGKPNAVTLKMPLPIDLRGK